MAPIVYTVKIYPSDVAYEVVDFLHTCALISLLETFAILEILGHHYPF